MIAVVQRVSRADVHVPATGYRAEIGGGLLILLGVERGDSRADADWLAGKIARLRIFADADGNLNRSLRDEGGAALVISQFTLAADCRKGNRPSFDRAAPAALAGDLYQYFVGQLRESQRIPTRAGVFGAMMEVQLTNSGPVTIILRHPP